MQGLQKEENLKCWNNIDFEQLKYGHATQI